MPPRQLGGDGLISCTLRGCCAAPASGMTGHWCARAMFVYLMRHGLAVEPEAEGAGDDFSRPLSEDGTHRMEVQAAAFRRMVGVVDEVWTSPLTRSRQSADIVAAAQSPKLPVRELASLAPPEDVEAILDQLRRAHDDLSAVIVGHELGLGELASRMLAGRAMPLVKVPCGAVCCLEMVSLDPLVRAQLHWLLTPRQLRALM